MGNRTHLAAAAAALASFLALSGPASASPESWPLEIIDRPLTLPSGSMSAGIAVDANHDFSTIGGAATGLWGVSFGVTDDLSLGVGYGFGLREPEGRGPLDVSAGYSVYSGAALSVAATAGYGHDFMSGSDAATAGALLWYMLGDKLALVSGGDQLAVGFDDSSVVLSVPVGLGYQPEAHVYLELDVDLLDLGIANADTAVLGADQVPIDFSAFFSPVRSLDLGASVSVEPIAGADSLAFGVVAVYYGGV